jgi:Chaperone of endosialidase
MNPLIQHKKATTVLFVTIVLACFGLLAEMRAAPQVVPAPDGCYPNYTTAEGCNTLNFLTTGAGNSGFGWYALYLNATGNFNTGVGGGALALNNADSNTAVGAGALLLNTAGAGNTAVGTDALVYNDSGGDNTANGAFALFSNTIGLQNTAIGSAALYSNTSGFGNTANGFQALLSNTIGNSNTATGVSALQSNTSGNVNVATGEQALFNNTTGGFNVASGANALFHNMTGSDNVAIGFSALLNNTGTGNIALGSLAGGALTTGDSNIVIGSLLSGVAGESNTTRIGFSQFRTFISGIRGVTTGNANAIPVLIDSNGQLGTMSSSRRFKHEIKPMDNASEAILALKPVTFYYKSDEANTPQFGLIAEEVAAVNPTLVVRDEKGEIYTVRYDAVNAMLLNEFLKEHRKVGELEATLILQKKDFQTELAQQKERIEALATGLEKLSVQQNMKHSAPKVVANRP